MESPCTQLRSQHQGKAAKWIDVPEEVMEMMHNWEIYSQLLTEVSTLIVFKNH